MIQAQPTDPDKKYIQTGRDNRITAFFVPDFQYTALGKFIIFRLLHDRDVKILITSRGKTTGTGKTTLAIILARWVNWARNDIFNSNYEWSAKGYSFMSVWDYLQKYKGANKGDPLITDELEYLADRRKHMTHENVKFSQAWSMLRYRNVVTIGTAPGLMDLEKRVPEGADIWINVTMQGRANVYYLTVDDFEWTPQFKRFKMYGYRETLLWDAIEKDEDYQYLKSQKEELGVPGIDDMNQVDEGDIKEKETELKTRFVKEFLKMLKEKQEKGEVSPRVFSQGDVAEASGFSQQTVSKIKINMEKEGEL